MKLPKPPRVNHSFGLLSTKLKAAAVRGYLPNNLRPIAFQTQSKKGAKR